MDPTCPFCARLAPGSGAVLLGQSAYAAAFADAYPSAPGHTLVVPRRHVARLRDLHSEESESLFRLAQTQLGRLEDDTSHPRPDGYTIGINDGEAAGQTIPHVHLHLIPRHLGDTADPTGGIRWALPETAAYWETPSSARS